MPPSGYRDYFKVLGVERTSSPEEIKAAFRKLARSCHPDVNPGDANAEDRFKEISEAYEVLSDPEKRRRYEQFGQYWNQSPGMGGYGANSPGFDIDFGQYGNFDEFINELLGRFGGSGGSKNGFPRQGSKRPINLDAEVIVHISFAEAFNGTERILSVNEERVQVIVPKGVKNGSRLRLKGKGNLQPGTGRRGDLYLIIEITPHPIWRLDGEHLRADLPVSIDEIALGATIKVVTLDGLADLHIPLGTGPGSQLRLKGKGWPLPDARGDLLFTLTLIMPEEWSAEELNTLKTLQKIRCNDPRESWLKSATI